MTALTGSAAPRAQRVPAVWRLALRTRLQLAVLLGMTLALTGLVTAFNLILHSRLQGDANAAVVARADGQLAALDLRHGRLVLGETADAGATDSSTWVFRGSHAIEAPAATAVETAAAQALAGGPRRFRDLPSLQVRLYAVPVLAAHRRAGTVVSAVSLAPYVQTSRDALLASGALGCLVLLLVFIAARWLITRALTPVAEMTRLADMWSERDLDRRFALGPPRDELTELAATLDRLLGRLATSLRHEQRLTAELSHELRTPLAHIFAEAQHALRHGQAQDPTDGYTRIRDSAAQMTRTIDSLLAAARADLDPRSVSSDPADGARAAIAVCASLAARTSTPISLCDGSGPARVATTVELVERTLAPLLENACRHAQSTVTVTLRASDQQVELVVEDDGPGIDVRLGEMLFEPGYRGSDRTTSGAGLGLALARRLARSAGGEVTLGRGSHGATFVVTLPRA